MFPPSLPRIFLISALGWRVLFTPCHAEDPPSVADELAGAELAKLALGTEIGETPDGPSPEQLRKLDRLADVYCAIAERHPESLEARHAAGSFLWSLNRHDQAKAQWDAAAKLDPDNPETVFCFGLWYLTDGEVRQAVARFRRAVELQPDNALYRHTLGNALFVFRRENSSPAEPTSEKVVASALEQLRLAAELAPANEEFARGYAETFYGIENPDWKEALAAWLHFYEISSEKDFAATHIARVAINLGDAALAREYIARIQDPGYRQSSERLLKRLGDAGKLPRKDSNLE